MARPQTVYLIDGSAQLHRAYFAIKGLATTRGLPTNAVYGFTTMLRKLYEDEEPEWVAISFDLPGATFRHHQYTEYKATRRRMDDDLAVQLPYVSRVCEVFGLPRLDVAGFEADDVIATLARQAIEKGLKVVVVSGDKDLLQLVSDDVLVISPGREGAPSILYDRKTVEEKWGVPPERVVDVVALAKEYAPEAGPSRTEYAVLLEPDAIRTAVTEARKAGRVAVCFVRDAREPMRAQPLGVALAWQRGHAVYIPLGHSPLEVPDGRPAAELLELMRPLFEDPLVRKLSARGKHDRIMLCE